MPRLLEIARFTLMEIACQRAFIVLTLLCLLIPVVAAIFSNLFMFEIGKVRIDFMVAAYRLVSTIFLLFIAVPLFARDLGQRYCHLFLYAPVQRHEYLLGRFLGLLAGLFLLALTASLAAEVLVLATLSSEPEVYRHGLTVYAGMAVAGLTFYQHISLLGSTVLICAFSTGLPEMLVFTSGFILIAWTLPPVIAAMQTAEVMEHTPVFVSRLIEAIHYLLPSINGGELGIAIAHGLTLNTPTLIANIAEHGGYALLTLALAWWLFNRRDL